VLDVKIKEWPCHAAGKPVAMIPNCSATRHAHFTLDGSGPSFLEPPNLDEWPKVTWAPDQAAQRVDLDNLTSEEVQSWRHGDRLLLNGAMLTGRDAAHKRIQDMLAKGEPLPVDFRGRATTTSARSTRSWAKWSGPLAPPRRHGWTSSPRRCSALAFSR
jgi:fumarate hydratase class I